MRPGLDKPGALPLLALIVFSLLTLVPSLSSIYNIKFADFSYFTGGARKLPLIQDGVAAFPPETPPMDPQKSWVMTAQYRTRGNRILRSSRSNGAPSVPGEVTPVENKSRLSYTAPESSSFMFGRRARAFRTYFIQQLDDYQLFTSFSNRSLPAAPTILNPPLTPSNASPLPTSIDDHRSETTPYPDNNSSPPYTSPREETGLQIPTLCNNWQQVCRRAIGLWEHAKHTASISRVQPLIQLGSKYLESMLTSQNATAEQLATLPRSAKDGPHASTGGPGLAAQNQKLQAPSDQPTDAAAHTAELRGSCMAIVIGLVAGIMWF
ncbi:uncharacterized protein N7496_006639 [Penicillium cataractarum]|uniref:Uncharacterized protein n=1 Tax=Penicillium cataractarum TaxID=2100454 RepID=A0A9W9S2M7_9EURO|nr:uncharacterized protein N7496_006639 [Penicillium cataractarum]KAJ5370547.1 hypothetical protein N7496_006639 [Penicillium cataractarum]